MQGHVCVFSEGSARSVINLCRQRMNCSDQVKSGRIKVRVKVKF